MAISIRNSTGNHSINVMQSRKTFILSGIFKARHLQFELLAIRFNAIRQQEGQKIKR